jgi:hypothetical protein
MTDHKPCYATFIARVLLCTIFGGIMVSAGAYHLALWLFVNTATAGAIATLAAIFCLFAGVSVLFDYQEKQVEAQRQRRRRMSDE